MASGDRFHSHNPRNEHIQQHQSFIQGKAKNEMIQDGYEQGVVHDEQPKNKKRK
ncbi:MAG: hypothetical protein PF513_08130 [Tenericutes bacterium]|jgi:hypothetical protein|nr:hypothetical protein [Mycoplasmatota bacterium]